MSNASEFLDATPSAALLIESIRDIGYTLETAIADLVDNSISAGANNIQIFLLNDKDNQPFLSVEDDGCGMTEEELLSAMRLGSKDPNIVRRKDDLGRFGLGLKTASFSQCRHLKVERTSFLHCTLEVSQLESLLRQFFLRVCHKDSSITL